MIQVIRRTASVALVLVSLFVLSASVASTSASAREGSTTGTPSPTASPTPSPSPSSVGPTYEIELDFAQSGNPVGIAGGSLTASSSVAGTECGGVGVSALPDENGVTYIGGIPITIGGENCPVAPPAEVFVEFETPSGDFSATFTFTVGLSEQTIEVPEGIEVVELPVELPATGGPAEGPPAYGLYALAVLAGVMLVAGWVVARAGRQ